MQILLHSVAVLLFALNFFPCTPISVIIWHCLNVSAIHMVCFSCLFLSIKLQQILSFSVQIGPEISAPLPCAGRTTQIVISGHLPLSYRLTLLICNVVNMPLDNRELTVFDFYIYFQIWKNHIWKYMYEEYAKNEQEILCYGIALYS